MPSVKRALRSVSVAEVFRGRPRTVRLHTTVEDLVTLFANDGAVAALVLDDRRQLRGVVERTEVCAAIESCPREPWPNDCGYHSCPLVGAAKPTEQERLAEPKPSTAADLMRPVLATVTAETPLGEAVALMRLADLRVLPVVRQDTKAVVGVLAIDDVTRWLAATSGHLPYRRRRAAAPKNNVTRVPVSSGRTSPSPA